LYGTKIQKIIKKTNSDKTAMPKPENIIPHQMKPGQTLNPNGRPKKYVTLLKEQGYKLAEINDTIQAMLSMDLDELKEVWQNPKATILEKTIANAMRKSLEKGSLYSIETLLSREYGKPKETADLNQTVSGEIKITLDLGE